MAILKVDTITSADTPTVSITDGASISGVTTFSSDINIADKIVHTGDTNTAIRFPASDKITLETSGTERFQVDSSGNIYVGGVGGSATAGTLWFNDTSANASKITQSNGNSALTFHTGSSQPERLRIDSDGRVGINTATMSTANAGFDDLVIRSSAGGNTGITFLSSTTAQGTLAFADGSSSTAPYRGYLQYSHNGDRLVLGAGGADRVTVDTDGNVNISGVTTAKTFVPTESQLSNRNLIINGAMGIAQRGTSSTSSGYKHIDRWAMTAEGANTTLTQSQVDVAAGTAPYQLGFRKAFKILNAGQSNSNVGGDTLRIEQHIEDQIIAQSGWNYKSSSSYLTLSFWVKSSVAQDFVILLQTRSDLGASGAYTYSQNFTISSADTWTKITTKIPGASSLTLDNDNTRGLSVAFYMYMGGDDTSGSHTDGAWQAYDNSDLALQQTITWWTTSNATIEYTGVQVEVGPVATPFEHLGYDKELARCMRYCEMIGKGNGKYISNSVAYTTDQMYAIIRFKVEKRTTPSLEHTTGTNYYQNWHNNTGTYLNGLSGVSWPNEWASGVYATSAMTAESAGLFGCATSGAQILFTAEL